MDEITKSLRDHYERCFKEHGAEPKGVDWRDNETADIRYGRMLAVIRKDIGENSVPRLLDVGCGFGGLLGYAQKRGISIDYIGIDVVSAMINEAQTKFPHGRFICGDILTDMSIDSIDYVVCNGILTQKLDASIRSMDEFAKALIAKMFSIAGDGIAFNMMSSFVNFTAPNLYYKNPIETLAFCMTTLSSHLKIDHSYGLYEYTTYVYRET